jgi:S-adenosylmethionine/arginine decarboxylase-like enzyme
MELGMDRRLESPVLGTRMHSQGFVFKGKMETGRWQSLLCAAAEAMGMSPVAHPALWRYPMEGAGGNGITIVQPITESFLALDIWPDHDGAYLFVCSCKPFTAAGVVTVARQFGLKPLDNTLLDMLSLVDD